jgi:hypothetical protein
MSPPPADVSVHEYASALADGIEAALPGWVLACVSRVVLAVTGSELSGAIAAAASEAGVRAAESVGAEVRTLLALDVDSQISTPLAIIRSAAVRYPTEVLQQAGIPPVERDPFAMRAFPADIYDLSPASFADLSPDLVDAGIAWGAAKAFVHKQRHRS